MWRSNSVDADELLRRCVGVTPLRLLLRRCGGITPLKSYSVGMVTLKRTHTCMKDRSHELHEIRFAFTDNFQLVCYKFIIICNENNMLVFVFV